MKHFLTLILMFSVGGMTFSFQKPQKNDLLLPKELINLNASLSRESTPIIVVQAGHSFLNQIVLDAGTANTMGNVKLEDKGDLQPWMSNFHSPSDKVEWKIESQEGNTYELQIELKTSEPSQLLWTLDGIVYHHHFDKPKNNKTGIINLGTLQLQKGIHYLSVQPDSGEAKSLEIKAMILKKV